VPSSVPRQAARSDAGMRTGPLGDPLSGTAMAVVMPDKRCSAVPTRRSFGVPTRLCRLPLP